MSISHSIAAMRDYIVAEHHESAAALGTLGSLRLPHRALALRACLYCVAAFVIVECGQTAELLTTAILSIIAALTALHAAIPLASTLSTAFLFPIVELIVVNAPERAWKYHITANSSPSARLIGLPLWVEPAWACVCVAMLDVVRFGARVAFLLEAKLPPK